MNDELNRHLGELKGLVERGFKDMDRRFDAQDEILTGQDERIDSLEKTRVQAFTIAGVFSFLAGLVGYKINE